MALTMEQWNNMVVTILAGKPFEDVSEVPKTAVNRQHFEDLKLELAEMRRKGIRPEVPFD